MSSSDHRAKFSTPDKEDEEEDYMSDAFLHKLEKDNVRPGLKFVRSIHIHLMLLTDSIKPYVILMHLIFQSRNLKREHQQEKKRQNEADEARERKAAKIGKAKMEVEEREKGMNKQLDQTNKGFAMLQKMGYKEGEKRAMLQRCVFMFMFMFSY
jgi:hypothetical protein